MYFFLNVDLLDKAQTFFFRRGAIPVQPPRLFQHFKHVLLEDVQPPVTTALHIYPDDVKVERWLFRGSWIHSGNLSQRVAVASTLFVLVAHYRHKQIPDELSHQSSHSGRTRVVPSLLLLSRLQQHSVQHQSVSIDQRLGLVVDAGVVEHEGKVFKQSFDILVPACRHMASNALHVDGFLDCGVVVRQFGTRRQTEEDCT